MKTQHKILFFLLFVCIQTVYGQKQPNTPSRISGFLDKTQFALGGTYHFTPIFYKLPKEPVFDPYPAFYGIYFGGTYLLAHSNDKVSLGVNAGTNISFSIGSARGGSFVAQVPVYLVGRVGARCTKYNEQRFGLGAGIGVNYTYLNFPYQTSSGYVDKVNTGFVAPAAMGEVSFNQGSNLAFTLRFHYNLMPMEGKLSTNSTTSEKVTFSNFGLSLLYEFGL